MREREGKGEPLQATVVEGRGTRKSRAEDVCVCEYVCGCVCVGMYVCVCALRKLREGERSQTIGVRSRTVMTPRRTEA